MQAIKLICNSRNRFRLGLVDLGHTSEWLHSDTLFSAMVNAHHLLYGSKETHDFVKLFHARKITLSSAFYLVEIRQNGKLAQQIFFLPKIFGKIQPRKPTSNEAMAIKQLKKIKFLSLPVFRQMLNGMYLENQGIKFDIDLKSMPKLDNKFVLSKDEAEHLLNVGFSDYQSISPCGSLEAPRVSLEIDPKKNEPVGPYYQTDLKLYFEQRASLEWQTHFYFLCQLQLTSTEETKFYSSLTLLADEGIGGKRSSGAGWFEGIEILDFPGDWNGAYQTNLSLISPINDDMNKIYAYDSFVRGGWIYLGKDTNEAKKKVRLIKEGAIFRGEMNGALVPVGNFNGTTVYQNGLNFGLNFGEKP